MNTLGSSLLFLSASLLFASGCGVGSVGEVDAEGATRRNLLVGDEDQGDGESAYVVTVYREVLGRMPTPNELAYWRSRIDSGEVTREAVRDALLASPEYVASHTTPPALPTPTPPGTVPPSRNTFFFCIDAQGRTFTVIGESTQTCSTFGLSSVPFQLSGVLRGDRSAQVGLQVDKSMVAPEAVEVCLAFVLSEPGRVGETQVCDDQGLWVSIDFLLAHGWKDASYVTPERIATYTTFIAHVPAGAFTIHARSSDRRWHQSKPLPFIY